MKPVIVVSAQRFFQGGTVIIVRECLRYLSANHAADYSIKALVYRKALYPALPGIEYIEFPNARRSFLLRLYHEYIYFRKLSARWKPYLWLSMQDSTPNVHAGSRAVYFHNPLLFRGLVVKDLWQQPRIFVLTLLYRFVYIRRISRNNHIIVQQQWIRNYFIQQYKISPQQIIVAPPVTSYAPAAGALPVNKAAQPFRFIYPAHPFVHKNFEVIFRAAAILHQRSAPSFTITFTRKGDENAYIRQLKKKYVLLPELRFIGYQEEGKLHDLFKESDCLLFPSRAETWGLPLSEFRQLNKPVITVDLPYARETLGDYDKAKFIAPGDAVSLADAMYALMKNKLLFDNNEAIVISPPFAKDWRSLWEDFLLK